jgi:NAD(P)-dependent dehydrogenase (short-subunit alcohol dehydrogenase family)
MTQAEYPDQQQEYPGAEGEMNPRPASEMRDYLGSGLLADKRALITGGDSGIGRAVAVAFAKEGADVAIAYLDEEQEGEDARRTAELVAEAGRRCVLLPGDLGDEAHCGDVVESAARELGGLDILVNHHGTQKEADDVTKIDTAQWERTFQVNVTAVFWLTKAALAHLPRGGAIVNTASVNGLRGNAKLVDYAASKGAVLALTYALAQSLLDRGIRVNAVAPGPVWTPLIPSTFSADHVRKFGQHVPMGRAAQPDEIAPSYVFFAANRLSSYYTGEVLAPVGGEIHPG